MKLLLVFVYNDIEYFNDFELNYIYMCKNKKAINDVKKIFEKKVKKGIIADFYFKEINISNKIYSFINYDVLCVYGDNNIYF